MEAKTYETLVKEEIGRLIDAQGVCLDNDDLEGAWSIQQRIDDLENGGYL